MCCSILQCVAAWCTMLQCINESYTSQDQFCGYVCCNVVQRDAVCCSVMQCGERIAVYQRIMSQTTFQDQSCGWAEQECPTFSWHTFAGSCNHPCTRRHISPCRIASCIHSYTFTHTVLSLNATHTHTHTHNHTHAHTHTQPHTHTHTHTHTQTHTQAYRHTYTHPNVHTHMHVHARTPPSSQISKKIPLANVKNIRANRAFSKATLY